MSTPEPRAVWDEIAARFDATRQRSWQAVLDVIATIPQDAVVVDLGCGNGRHLLPAAARCDTAIGLDFSRKLLSIVQAKVKDAAATNIDLIQADLCHLPLCDATADAVLYIAALHNIQGRTYRRQALAEVRRILAPSGVALISVWSRWQDRYRWHFLRQAWRRSGEFGDIEIPWRQRGRSIGRFYHLYSSREFRSDIEAGGLVITSLRCVKMRSRWAADNYFATVRKA